MKVATIRYAAFLLSLAPMLPAPRALSAQSCVADGERARVCSVELFGAAPGERLRDLDPGRAIVVPMDSDFELEMRARDEWNRTFPRDRILLGFDLDYRCRDLLEIERGDEPDRLLVRAGTRQGVCQVVLWMPGNLNLEWPLTFEVAGRARTGYSLDEAEYVTARLYEALLGRSPDPGGLAGHSSAIARGDLAGAVNSLVGSSEFRSRLSGRTASEMLEQIYRGLLGRAPAAAGVRTYLGAAEVGHYGDIVWKLLHSDEFERRLVAQLGGG